MAVAVDVDATPDPSPPEIDTGIAGASARREHERRRARRETRVRDAHPVIGGLVLALSDEPSHERAWARGAAGEERVASSLAKHLDEGVVVLHDRRIPGSRANIDHIAVARSGVWVIDAKRYRGKVTVSKPFFGRPKLTVAGQDKTKLIEGLAKQVGLVESAVAEVSPGAPVHGALCFVDAELPLVGTLSLQGYALLYPKRLAKRINAGGPLTPEAVRPLATRLSERFPRA